MSLLPEILSLIHSLICYRKGLKGNGWPNEWTSEWVSVAVDLALATSRLDKGNARKRISSPVGLSPSPLSSRMYVVLRCVLFYFVTLSEVTYTVILQQILRKMKDGNKWDKLKYYWYPRYLDGWAYLSIQRNHGGNTRWELRGTNALWRRRRRMGRETQLDLSPLPPAPARRTGYPHSKLKDYFRPDRNVVVSGGCDKIGGVDRERTDFA